MLKKSNHFLFHAVLNELKSAHIQNQHLLVGVSGGLDSMSLLTVLLSLSRILQLQISVVHVHHGSEEKQQKLFQDKALELVQDFCIKNSLSFYANIPFSPSMKEGVGANEADLRAFRYQVFLEYFKKSKADFLALAHTAEDLLETQILRLIRGTGAEGIKAIHFKRGRLLRPFIGLSRTYIKSYIQEMGVNWCEDPTNQATDYSLRNWVRNKWFPALEAKRPGSLKAMARSLNLLANVVDKNQRTSKQMTKNLIKKGALRRDRLLAFPVWTRQEILAHYLREQGISDYSLGHIKEILRQLQRKQKNFQFCLLGKTWQVNTYWLTYTSG